MPLDLIRLDRRPAHGAHCLSVNRLAISTSYAKLAAMLSEAGGLIDNLVLHRADNRQWALVQFYSESDCERCMAECDGRTVDGSRIEVRRFSKPLASHKETTADALELPGAKAIDVMNHFVGWNRWSHELVSLRTAGSAAAVPAAAAAAAAAAASEQLAVVRVHLPDGAGTIDGEGSATPVAEGRPEEALSRAKKAALTNALRAALSRLVIVRFASGKTVVRRIDRQEARPLRAAVGEVDGPPPLTTTGSKRRRDAAGVT